MCGSARATRIWSRPSADDSLVETVNEKYGQTWAGWKVFEEETGSIEEVARRLGMRSLDRAARFIGLSWRPEPPDGARA